MEIAVFVEVVEAVDDAVNVEEDCYLIACIIFHFAPLLVRLRRM